MVEVRATIVTWVEGRPAGCEDGGEDCGVRVWIMVPSWSRMLAE